LAKTDQVNIVKCCQFFFGSEVAHPYRVMGWVS